MAGHGSPLSEVDREKAFELAKMELEYKVNLFNTLNRTCFNKCIDKRYKEGETNMGENSCVDRCASKYWQVTNIIGQMIAASRGQATP